MADKKENVQLEKTMDKAEQEKLESVKKQMQRSKPCRILPAQRFCMRS